VQTVAMESETTADSDATGTAGRTPGWLRRGLQRMIAVAAVTGGLGSLISAGAATAAPCPSAPAGTVGVDMAKYLPPRPCLHPLPPPPAPAVTPAKPPPLPPEFLTVPPVSSPAQGPIPSPGGFDSSAIVRTSTHPDPGIADASLASICPPSGCTTSFALFKGGLGITRARTIVPYDTFATYDPNAGCVSDYTQNIDHDTNQPYYLELYYWLQAASRNGLTPTLALGQGTGQDPNSGEQDPGLPTSRAAPGEPWALYDYYCGMYYLMYWTEAWGYPVYQWEAFNEPDTYGASFTYTDDDNVWIWANLASESFSGETVGALTMSSMIDTTKTSYVENFISNLRTNRDPIPSTYSLHDYLDVDVDAVYNITSYMSNLSAFESALSAEGVNGEPIWITEAGVRLNDPNYSLGQYIDGNGLDQAWGAQAFKTLASQPQVTEAFWYEFQTYDNNNNDYDRFDSASVGADGSGLDDGNPSTFAVFRPSYCVLTYGLAPSSASTNSACNDNIGFTGPAEVCGSSGPFDQPESQFNLAQFNATNSDWEDPCNG
jgi:hypothetical protein